VWCGRDGAGALRLGDVLGHPGGLDLFEDPQGQGVAQEM
jgi:hypothetical protein